jgi:hypothetical protein
LGLANDHDCHVLADPVAASSAAWRAAETTVGRAIGSVWIAMVISMFILFLAVSYSHGTMATMLGMSNAACALLLRWKQQFACAVVWWAAAVVACFGNATLMMIGFMTATFLCWIVIGVYVTISDSRTSQRGRLAHV